MALNFIFGPTQQPNDSYNHNTMNTMNPMNPMSTYQDSAMYDEENENEQNYDNEHEELSRKEYWKEYELDYTPNIVRWMKSNYLQHIKGEQQTVLIGGYDHCDKYYLQTLIYGKSEDQQSIQVIADDKISLSSEISDIQFADDQTAVIVTRNGQIQLIKLEQNDEYSPRSTHQHNNNNNDDDEKMIVLNDNNNNNNNKADNDNKWNLIPLNHPISCYPDPKNEQYPAVLTSVTVNTICQYGNIVASDESGYIYINDIDQQKQKPIPPQKCSSSAINCIRFANSDQIASVSMSGQLMIWDLRDELKNVCYTATVPRKHGSLISLAVHPHRNHIFSTGTEYGTIAIWDIRGTNKGNHESYKLFTAHCKHTLVNDIKFLTNNSNTMNGLVTCGNDGITQIYQSEQDDDWKDLSQSAWNTNITTIQEERYPVSSLDFYEQLSIVATCCDAQKLSFFPI